MPRFPRACHIYNIYSASKAKLTNRRDSLKFLNISTYIYVSNKSKMFKICPWHTYMRMNNSQRMRVDGRRWPFREDRLLTVHTFIVSLLKAWKVTMVRTECDDAAFGRSINVC